MTIYFLFIGKIALYFLISKLLDIKKGEWSSEIIDVKMSAIRDTIKGYHIYRSIILEISKKVKRKLREIDKALFKFHKIKSLEE